MSERLEGGSDSFPAWENLVLYLALQENTLTKLKVELGWATPSLPLKGVHLLRR